MATEENTPPTAGFVVAVPAGSVELPNHKWLRSPRQKDYAICLDPEDQHCGWLMLEGWANNWMGVRQLSEDDLKSLLTRADVNQAHRALIMAHLGMVGNA